MCEPLQKSIKKPKDCNFITLHDTSIFKEVRMPESATNYVLWYKKNKPNSLGFNY